MSWLSAMRIRLSLETPVNLTRRQKELPREFAEGGSEITLPESTRFLARVRDQCPGAGAEKVDGQGSH